MTAYKNYILTLRAGVYMVYLPLFHTKSLKLIGSSTSRARATVLVKLDIKQRQKDIYTAKQNTA